MFAWKIQFHFRGKFTAGAFLAFIGGVGAMAGFSRTVMGARKQDEKLYEKATIETANLLESGHRLATRALAWGTLYAFLGTGTLCYGIWKLSGATNVNASNHVRLARDSSHDFHLQMDEFRQKMGSILPRISRNSPPTSRTDFDGMNDLLEYLTTWRKDQ